MFCTVCHTELSPYVSFNSLAEQYELGFRFYAYKKSVGVCERRSTGIHVFLSLKVCDRKHAFKGLSILARFPPVLIDHWFQWNV